MGLAVRVLGRAGLPGQGPPGQAVAVRGAAGLVHDPRQRVDELAPLDLREIERPVRALLREHLIPYEVGYDGRPPRRQRRVELGHGEQRLLVFSLPDREVPYDGFGPPAAPQPVVVPLSGVGEEARPLGRKVDPRRAPEAELPHPRKERVEADPLPRLVEPDVARVLDRFGEVQATVSPRQPATEVAGVVPEPAIACVGVVGLDREVGRLHADRRHDELPRGSRRVGSHGDPVQQRVVRVFAERVPQIQGDAADERVGVEGGVAVEQEHLSGNRVQRHDAAPHPFGKHRIRVHLQVEIDAEMQVISGHRRLRLRDPQIPHDRTQGVHFRVADPVTPGQPVLVLLFEPRLPDRLAGLVAGILGSSQLFLTDLPHVTDHVCDRGPRRIAPVRPLIHDDTPKPGSALLDERDLLEVRVLAHDERLARTDPIARQQRGAPLGRQFQPLREAIESGGDGIAGTGQHRHIVPGHVVRDGPPVAIVDGPARRRHRDGPQPVLARTERVQIGAEDLEIDEPGGDDRKAEEDRARRPAASLFSDRAVFVVALHILPFTS